MGALPESLREGCEVVGTCADLRQVVAILPTDVDGYRRVLVANDGDAYVFGPIAGSRIGLALRELGISPDALEWMTHEPLARPVERWLYFIADEDWFIKIGSTSSVADRLAQLQTATRQKLTLLATVPGSYDDERALHERFSAAHVRGEWFRSSPDLLEHVAILRGER